MDSNSCQARGELRSSLVCTEAGEGRGKREEDRSVTGERREDEMGEGTRGERIQEGRGDEKVSEGRKGEMGEGMRRETDWTKRDLGLEVKGQEGKRNNRGKRTRSESAQEGTKGEKGDKKREEWDKERVGSSSWRISEPLVGWTRDIDQF